MNASFNVKQREAFPRPFLPLAGEGRGEGSGHGESTFHGLGRRVVMSVRRIDQSGFGLVEFMIAMTVGLILIAGVGYLYVGSRGAFRTTENISRIQENARFALDMMSRDIRMAGYIGCGNIASKRINNMANPPVPQVLPENSLIGYDIGSGWVNPTSVTRVPGTDVLTVLGAFGRGVNLSTNAAPTNNLVAIANPENLAVGDILAVTDCKDADVFVASGVSNVIGGVRFDHTSSTGNVRQRVGIYGSEAFIMRVDQYTYFIGINPANNPALYRIRTVLNPAENLTTISGDAEELVENVQDMQIRYGLDTNGDGAVDAFSDTPGNWQQVASVTVNLLMRSPDNNVATANPSLTFNNGTFNAPDRRLYQVFTTTIGVRNRVPPM